MSLHFKEFLRKKALSKTCILLLLLIRFYSNGQYAFARDTFLKTVLQSLLNIAKYKH